MSGNPEAASGVDVKPSAPSTGGRKRLLAFVLTAVVAVAAITAYVVLTSPAGPSPTGGIPEGKYVANAGDFVAAADWNAMVTVAVELHEYEFRPQELAFEAGKPYKLEIRNAGAEKHYFTAEEFYRSIALRKAQTSEGEFKAPYLKAVEVFPGDQVDIYFVPVVVGVYDSICTITGHADQGMTGRIHVTGATPTSPAPILGDVSAGEWVQNAADLVAAANWSAMQVVRVTMTEFSFTPVDLALSIGQPYKIEIQNAGVEKHYFTAEAFYQTAAFRKAQDSSGEIKAPYFKAVEVFPGKQVDLYLIPTLTGTYDSVCTIAGHQAAGMHGHIVVTP